MNTDLKKLGIAFVADKTPNGIEEARWKVMQSILISLVVAGAIRIDVQEIDGKTVVTGYTFVENNLPNKLPDNLHIIDRKSILKATIDHPFLEVIMNATFNSKYVK